MVLASSKQVLFENSSYSDIRYPVHYWLTASGIEVDYVLEIVRFLWS